MKKVLWLLLAVFILGPRAHAQNRVTLKFQDLKALIEKGNERVLGKKKDLEGAREREGYFVRSFLPSAELHAAQEQFKKGALPSKSQPTYGAELKVNLFNGGRDKLEEDRRNLVAVRKRFERDQVFSAEFAKAQEAYWRTLYLRDFIEVLKEARKNNAENLKAAERRIRGGVATESDRVEFQMQDIDLKRGLRRAEFELGNQMRTLSVLLGLAAGTVIDLPEKLQHEHDWEKMVGHSEADHEFLVKPVELMAKEAEIQASSQSRSWLPQIEAFAAYNQFNEREEDHPEPSDRTENVVGVRITMNLFEGLSGRSEAVALAREAEAAKLEAKYTEREVVAHIHGEIEELKFLHDQVHEAEENIQRAEKYYRLTRSEYSRGVKNSPDMLGATEKLINMRQKRLEIVRDFQIAKSHVLSKIGK